jgi:hypothetical protein
MTSFYLPKLGNWPTPRLDVRVGRKLRTGPFAHSLTLADFSISISQ